MPVSSSFAPTMSNDLATRRQRLKTAIKAVEQARANAGSKKQETSEAGLLAAALAAVQAVADLVPDIKVPGGILFLKPKTEDSRKGHRLADEVAKGKLDYDTMKMHNKLKQIEGKIGKSDALAQKIKDTKSNLSKSADKLKQKNGTPGSVEIQFAEIGKMGSSLADDAAALASAMKGVASAAKAAAINRILDAILRRLTVIARQFDKVTGEVKKKGG